MRIHDYFFGKRVSIIMGVAGTGSCSCLGEELVLWDSWGVVYRDHGQTVGDYGLCM